MKENWRLLFEGETESIIVYYYWRDLGYHRCHDDGDVTDADDDDDQK